MNPTVSVIIPTYNCARFLPEALDAVLNQTRPPDQVLVIDDGSTDDTAQVCERYAGQIQYVHQPNAGASAARNTALRLATGDFIALMDADDHITPDRFAKLAEALISRPDAVACFSGHWVFNEREETGRYPGVPDRGDRPPEDFAAFLLTIPMSGMLRRQALEGLQFPVGVTTGEDMLFMALLRRRGPFVILPDVLYGYRRHAASATSRTTDLESVRQRVGWVRANAATHWPELDVDAFERLVWRALAEGVHGHYWARRRREFLHLRQVLREHWPAHLPTPPEARLRWYPEVVWRLKGLLDAARGRGAS